MKVPALKFLILRLLQEGPKTGYEIMKRLEEMLGSSYPGSVYPILRWWEEKGFVEKREKYRLTPRGEAFLKELENKRKQYLEMVKRDLLALSRALGDREMEELSSYIPLREKIGDEGMVILSRILEILTACDNSKKEELKKFLRTLC